MKRRMVASVGGCLAMAVALTDLLTIGLGLPSAPALLVGVVLCWIGVNVGFAIGLVA